LPGQEVHSIFQSIGSYLQQNPQIISMSPERFHLFFTNFPLVNDSQNMLTLPPSIDTTLNLTPSSDIFASPIWRQWRSHRGVVLGLELPFVANVASYLVTYEYTNTKKLVLHLSYLVRLDW